MRFPLDVHIGLHISRALAESGHDVIRAALAYPVASDMELIVLSFSEGCVLITEDSDFTDLIFAHGHRAPPSLIFIRCEPFEQSAIAERLGEIIDRDALLGRVAVVTARQVRYRPFPKGKD